uniref:Uncharacterized protein n=1 Tax=Parascaris univalens TaxID=6257 RepID=A0A915CAA5_PARUN
MGGDERRCGGHASTCHVLAHRLVCAVLHRALARIRLVDDSGTANSCCSRGSARYRKKVPYYSRFKRPSLLPPIETVIWPTGRQFTAELGKRKIRQLIEKRWAYPCSLRYSVDSFRLVVTNSTLRYKYCVRWTKGKKTANVYFNIDVKRHHLDDVVRVSYTFEGGTALHTPRSSRFHIAWLRSLDRYE